MPMHDIAKRHAEVFRIRIGDKDEKGKPRRLTDSMRVTSPNRSVVDAFVAVCGGETKAWEGEWEAYLPTSALPVLVLPGQSISQWWEFYRGSVCERRCDGFTEIKSNSPCMCPSDIEARVADTKACSPMTRVNVLCPDVEVVGAGALVTHGMVAAETLPQSIAVAEAALSRGLLVPAVLRVVEHVGKGRRYIVPQLEIVGVSFAQLRTGEVPAALERVGQPVAALEPGDTPEVIPAAAVDEVAAREARELETDQASLFGTLGRVGPDQRGLLGKAWKEAGLPVPHNNMRAVSREDMPRAQALVRQWAALTALAEAGFTSEKARHEAVRDATGGETESTKALTVDQFRDIVEFCAAKASVAS